MTEWMRLFQLALCQASQCLIFMLVRTPLTLYFVPCFDHHSVSAILVCNEWTQRLTNTALIPAHWSVIVDCEHADSARTITINDVCLSRQSTVAINAAIQ